MKNDKPYFEMHKSIKDIITPDSSYSHVGKNNATMRTIYNNVDVRNQFKSITREYKDTIQLTRINSVLLNQNSTRSSQLTS